MIPYTCDLCTVTCYHDEYIIDCNHHFCDECLLDSIKSTIINDNTTIDYLVIKCPKYSCDYNIPNKLVSQILREYEEYGLLRKFNKHNSVCEICYNTFEFIEIEIIEDCEHFCCTDCLVKWIETVINDGGSKIMCPHNLCKTCLSYDYINKIVTDNDKYYLLKEYTDNCECVIDNGIRLMCPTCNCICKKSSSYGTHAMYCGSCNQCYCYVCNEIHEYGDYSYCRKESEISELLSEVSNTLGSTNVKLCPICRIIIDKIDGCNSMKCENCKVKFCWICLQTKSIIDNVGTHECYDYGIFHGYNDNTYVDGYDYDY